VAERLQGKSIQISCTAWYNFAVQSVSEKIVSRIYGHGRGWAFTRIDFLDLGGVKTVDSALLRLYRKGTVRRVAAGVYDYPGYSEFLKTELSPDITRVAGAIARKHHWNITPDGSTAQHILGLNEQVPAQYRYLSTGPSRSYHIMGIVLSFAHRKTQHTALDDEKSALLVQAIHAAGEGGLTPAQIEHLSRVFHPDNYPRIVRTTISATAWVHDYIKQIAAQASTRKPR
jgi:hypothetical protein